MQLSVDGIFNKNGLRNTVDGNTKYKVVSGVSRFPAMEIVMRSEDLAEATQLLPRVAQFLVPRTLSSHEHLSALRSYRIPFHLL